MAITAPVYTLYRDAAAAGLIPSGGDLLEFGEANWYGDLAPEVLRQDIAALVQDPKRRLALESELAAALAAPSGGDFKIAKVFFRLYFDPKRHDAIDYHGTEIAIRHDLNTPYRPERPYDVCINNGTAEHIFNIATFFASVHAATKPGGLMFHESPLLGWIDHGFYTLQPTLYFDLAEANGYFLMGLYVCSLSPSGYKPLLDRKAVVDLMRELYLPRNATLFALLRKGADESPFRWPTQGLYAGRLGEDAVLAWRQTR